MPDGQEGYIRAAGAVVWRPGDQGPDIALVHRPRYDDWSFPKGKCRREEHVLTTAVREVMEETGLRVVLGRPLAPSVYQVGGRAKWVSYWAARCVGSVPFVPGEEVDHVSWLPATQVERQLSYERDAALLDEFLAGPARSTPLIVLRHAVAMRKSKVNPGDLARPLDARGEAQATLLASVLACYGRCRVISSAAERCLATVRPYATALGIPVEAEPAFTVPAPDPAGGTLPAEAVRYRASQRVIGLASSGAPSLICAHRENLPLLLDTALDAFGARQPHGRPLTTGAFWVLQSDGGVLVSSERHDVGLLARAIPGSALALRSPRPVIMRDCRSRAPARCHRGAIQRRLGLTANRKAGDGSWPTTLRMTSRSSWLTSLSG
jgi:8-oxo-dGTP diphosphatase